MDAPSAIEVSKNLETPIAWLWPAYFAFLIFTLTFLSPGRTRIAVAIAEHAVFIRHSLQYSFPNFSDSYVWFSAPLPQCAFYVAFVIFGSPEKELYPLSEGKAPASRTLFEKLKWSASLLINPRGVGWSHQARHLHFHQDSDPRFLIRQLFWTIFGFLVVDLNKATTDFVRDRGIFDAKDFFNQPFYLQAFLAIFSMIAGWGGMLMIHSSVSFLAVLFRLTTPQEWPDFNGSLWQTSSLATLWRSTWHQMLQPSLRKMGNLLSHRILGIKAGTQLDRVVLLFTAFLGSGCIHAWAAFAGSRGGRAHELSPDMWKTDFLFFMLQPVALLIEGLVCRVAQQRFGIRRDCLFANVVGRLWVLTWLAFTMRIMVGPHARAGLWDRKGSEGPGKALLALLL